MGFAACGRRLSVWYELDLGEGEVGLCAVTKKSNPNAEP
jgi:hypothetical protein